MERELVFHSLHGRGVSHMRILCVSFYLEMYLNFKMTSQISRSPWKLKHVGLWNHVDWSLFIIIMT